MKAHKYHIGQTVNYKPSGPGRIQGSGDVKIERLLPPDQSENLYQVESLFDGHKRVVRESEIL
jgi:hypothetical protein